MIEEFPTDTCAVEGEGVFFKVVVRGNPPPALSWYQDDILLKADYSMEIQQDGSLSITSSELRHSGVYRLLARNNRGTAQRVVRLTVTQEEDEPNAIAQERVKIPPVPVTGYGKYAVENHAHSDKMFRLQYNVQ